MSKKDRLIEVLNTLQSGLAEGEVSPRLLDAAREAIDDYEAEVRATELKARYEAALKIAKDLGLDSLSELEALANSGKGRVKAGVKQKTAGVPLYRNSIDPSQTWTGRGRKPGWVQTFLDNGGKLEELKIGA